MLSALCGRRASPLFPAAAVAAAYISIKEAGAGEGASAVAAAAKKWDNRKILGGPALLVIGFMRQLPFLVQYSSIFFGKNLLLT